jgi:hypothetical protein
MEIQVRNLGEQPIADIMKRHGLSPHDIVAASAVPMTHKMVSRAAKGRWLTIRTKQIVLNALNRATGIDHRHSDLFNY